ncbi:hypothetical protein F5Y01DRAFT_318358 [Xylaria sp. FL0043]|nr:hypothetical protein F5Y01DRAFT_318358 [Xylaria sp. FL0043]
MAADENNKEDTLDPNKIYSRCARFARESSHIPAVPRQHWDCGHCTLTHDEEPFDKHNWIVATQAIGLSPSKINSTCPSCIIKFCLERVRAIGTCFNHLLNEQERAHTCCHRYIDRHSELQMDLQGTAFDGLMSRAMSALNHEIRKNFRRRMEQATAQQDWVLATDRMLMLLDGIIMFSEHALHLFSSPSSAERSLLTTLYDEAMDLIMELEEGVEDVEQSHQELANWIIEHPENGVIQQVSGIRQNRLFRKSPYQEAVLWRGFGHTSSLLRHLLSGLIGGVFVLLLVSVLSWQERCKLALEPHSLNIHRDVQGMHC